jgi:WD40 repeat protein
LQQGNLGRAIELLRQHVPEEGEPDLRGFEWRYLWGLSRGDAKQILQAHDSASTCIAFSPDGNTVVTSGFDRKLAVWHTDPNEGLVATRSWNFDGPGVRKSVVFSAKGDLLAAGIARELVLIEVENWEAGRPLGSVSIYNDTCSIVFFGEDQLVAAKVSGGVGIWRLSSKERDLIPGEGSSFGALLAYCAQADSLAIADDSQIRLWDAQSRALHPPIDGSRSLLVDLVSSRKGDVLAAGRKDGSVELISVADQRVLQSWKAHASLAYALAFSPDGKYLATGGADQLIRLWEVAAASGSSSAPEPLRTLRGHEDQVWGLAFSPDGKSLVSTSKDGQLALWRVDPEEPIGASAESAIHFEPLRPGALYGLLSLEEVRSFNGRLVARFKTDLTQAVVQLHEAKSDRLLFRLSAHRINVASIEFSPSDRLLATGGHDNIIRLWETATGKERLVLRGHLTAVSALVFTSDERTLASGSTDGTVKLWSVTTGQEMVSESFSHGTVANLKFSADGQALGIQLAGDTQSVRYLYAPSWEKIETAEIAVRTAP